MITLYTNSRKVRPCTATACWLGLPGQPLMTTQIYGFTSNVNGDSPDSICVIFVLSLWRQLHAISGVPYTILYLPSMSCFSFLDSSWRQHVFTSAFCNSLRTLFTFETADSTFNRKPSSESINDYASLNE